MVQHSWKKALVYPFIYTIFRSFIRYNDPNEQLCNTDMDRIEQKPEPVGVPGKINITLND